MKISDRLQRIANDQRVEVPTLTSTHTPTPAPATRQAQQPTLEHQSHLDLPGEKERLRTILTGAIEEERQAEKKYRERALAVTFPAVHKLLLTLADEERSHITRMQEMLQKGLEV